MTKLDQIRALREDRAKRRSAGGKPRSKEAKAAPNAVFAAAVTELDKHFPVKPKRKPRAAKPAKPKTKAKKPGRYSPLGHLPTKPKVGRPRAEDRGKTLSDLKPWMAAKVSRATWYRSRAK